MTRTVFTRRCALGGATLLSGCLLLTGCAGGASPGSSAGEPAAGRAGVAVSHGAAYGARSAGGKTAGLTAGLTPANQSIVYTAAMTVRATDVAATARRITSITEAAGGYISAENGGSASPSGAGQAGQTIGITLKIPVPAYQAVLAQLSSPSLGKQLSMGQQATDVTQAVANVSSLVTSQQAAISALEGLLKRAGSVADLLQVQQQISADETTLNSLLAQQRALNSETSYATVSMTLVSPLRPAPSHKPAGHSFVSGLLAGWRAFRHAAGWLATALGAVLPFAVALAVLAAAGYAGWRRYLRRRAGPAAPAA